MKSTPRKIATFLWFNDNAEQAMKFYTSIFKDSKVLEIRRRKKKFLFATVRLKGQDYILFNGGPNFKFTPVVSLFVRCSTQQEVDDLWKKLSKGGEEVQCGWLRDKFGLSWQIVPNILIDLLGDKDPIKAERVFQAMLKMVKIDIQAIKRAYAGTATKS